MLSRALPHEYQRRAFPVKALQCDVAEPVLQSASSTCMIGGFTSKQDWTARAPRTTKGLPMETWTIANCEHSSGLKASQSSFQSACVHLTIVACAPFGTPRQKNSFVSREQIRIPRKIR